MTLLTGRLRAIEDRAAAIDRRQAAMKKQIDELRDLSDAPESDLAPENLKHIINKLETQDAI